MKSARYVQYLAPDAARWQEDKYALQEQQCPHWCKIGLKCGKQDFHRPLWILQNQKHNLAQWHSKNLTSRVLKSDQNQYRINKDQYRKNFHPKDLVSKKLLLRKQWSRLCWKPLLPYLHGSLHMLMLLYISNTCFFAALFLSDDSCQKLSRFLFLLRSLSHQVTPEDEILFIESILFSGC